MRSPSRFALAACVTALAVGGCGAAHPSAAPTVAGAVEDLDTATATDTATSPATATATGSPPIHAVGHDAADLVLVISNQSFEDETVRIDVQVDGVEVVDQDFAVEGQHNWIWFPLAAPSGERTVEVTADTGATETFTVEVPDDGPIHATVDYWYYPDQGDGQDVVDRAFTFYITEDPPGLR